MVCKKPFRQGLMEFGCGQCIPCRIGKRRLWTHRILLESFTHDYNSFVTLTYDESHLPEDGGLNHGHVQKFLKLLRKKVAPAKVRYFVVGEYGEKSGRPHYHLALFGFPRGS